MMKSETPRANLRHIGRKQMCTARQGGKQKSLDGGQDEEAYEVGREGVCGGNCSLVPRLSHARTKIERKGESQGYFVM